MTPASINFVFVMLFSFVVSQNNDTSRYEIEDFELNRCTGTQLDPIVLQHVTIEFGNESSPLIKGTFSTDIDLYPPIKVSTTMKMDFVFFWLTTSCIENVGSCTFNDICGYGVPENETCPVVFEHLPCRCPIKKGTYTIPNRISNIFAKAPILAGTYKATTTISSNDTRLACYDTKFKIKLL